MVFYRSVTPRSITFTKIYNSDHLAKTAQTPEKRPGCAVMSTMA